MWGPLKLLASIANQRQDAVLDFNITLARKASWGNALALAALPDAGKETYIKLMDSTVVKLARRITNPGFIVRLTLLPVLKRESKNVSSIIDMLYD